MMSFHQDIDLILKDMDIIVTHRKSQSQSTFETYLLLHIVAYYLHKIHLLSHNNFCHLFKYQLDEAVSCAINGMLPANKFLFCRISALLYQHS
jgi:hypothetical protein